MSNHLLRSHAPISDSNWTLLDDEARERLSAALAARRLVDFAGPLGWEYSATSLGRVSSLPSSPCPGVSATQRRVLPLAELRAEFRISRAELRGRRPRRRRRRPRTAGHRRPRHGRRREQSGPAGLAGGIDHRDRAGVPPPGASPCPRRPTTIRGPSPAPYSSCCRAGSRGPTDLRWAQTPISASPRPPSTVDTRSSTT